MRPIISDMTPSYKDKFFLEEIVNLRDKFQITTLIETGTWKGHTIKGFSNHFLKCISIEYDKECYDHALELTKNVPNIQLIHGNSVDVLRKILHRSQMNVMFFLDAHWNDYWPLLDELQTIADYEIKPVIAIHDFFTPDGNGGSKFEYDAYGVQALNFEYVQKKIENIYGSENYKHYCLDRAELNRGVGFFHPI